MGGERKSGGVKEKIKREDRSIDFSFRSNIERARLPFYYHERGLYSIDLASYGISYRIKWSTCFKRN